MAQTDKKEDSLVVNFNTQEEIRNWQKQILELKNELKEKNKIIKAKDRMIKKSKKEKNKLLNKLNSKKPKAGEYSTSSTFLYNLAKTKDNK